MDVIGTGVGYIILISIALVERLREHGCTGWTTFPVAVFDRDGQPIEHYAGFAVTGRCGPFDKARSTVVMREARVPGAPPFQVRVGLYFDVSTWDGSDIFLADDSAVIIVTKRVQELLKHTGNALLEPLSAFES